MIFTTSCSSTVVRCSFFFIFFFFIKLLVGFIIVLRLDTIIFNCSDRLQNKAVWIEN